MDVDLTDARKITARAQDQFDALNAKVETLLQEDPWSVEVVPEGDLRIVRLSIPEQPPEDWWLEVGELAVNARAGLEYLTRQLVIDSGNDPEACRTQFPIFEVEDDYLGRSGGRNYRASYLKGIASRHRQQIDKEQPYELGKHAAEHPLAALSALTNRHKHRERHTGVGFLKSFSVKGLYPEDVWIELEAGYMETTEPLRDRQELVTISLVPPEGDAEHEIAANAGFDIALPSEVVIDDKPEFTILFIGDRAISVAKVGEAVSRVAEIIERFERRLVAKRPRSRPSQ